MRRVLFIAYLYPPIANSGTRRSLSFVNHLPDHGWQPLVLTLADPPVGVCDKTLLSEVREGTSIHRVPLGSALMAQRMSRVVGSGALRLGSACIPVGHLAGKDVERIFGFARNPEPDRDP